MNRDLRLALRWGVPLAFAFGILVFHGLRTSAAVAVLQMEIATVQDDYARAGTERDTYFQRMIEIASTKAPFLVGRDLSSSDSIVRIQPEDGLYYVMDSSCPACASNLPFLNELSREFPGRVIGLAPDDDESEMRIYLDAHEVAFPVLVRGIGALPDALPIGATPMTYLVRAGELYVGLIGDLRARDRLKLVDNVQMMERGRE